MAEHSSDAPTKFATWQWLIGLTLVAIIVRLINLDSGVWVDEHYSIVKQFRLPVSALFVTYVGDNQHPLYAVLASLCVSIFGEHAWSVRLPAVIFGVATVPMLYMLGAQVSNRKEAILAAALLALSYHHVWFSQNARGYTALALAAVICSFYMIRLLLDKPQRKDVWAYGIIAALGCYAHLTMVFIVMGHFLVYLITLLLPARSQYRITNWKPALSAFFVAGFLTLIFYGPLLSQVIDYFANKPSMRGLSTPSWAIKEAMQSLSVGFGAGVIVLAGLVMMFVGFVSYFRSQPVALGIFVMPVFITILGAILARGTMYPRFFFALAGMAILIGVRGVMVTVRWSVNTVAQRYQHKTLADNVATATMVVVIIISALSLTRNYQYPKMDFEGAMNWLKTNTNSNDVIAIAGNVAAWPYRNYYNVDWPEMVTAADIAREEKKAQLKGGSVWLVYTFARNMNESAPEVLHIIQTRCTDERSFKGTLGGGDMITCRLKSV